MKNVIESEVTVSVINENEINLPVDASALKVGGAVPADVKAFLEKYYPNGLVFQHDRIGWYIREGCDGSARSAKTGSFRSPAIFS